MSHRPTGATQPATRRCDRGAVCALLLFVFVCIGCLNHFPSTLGDNVAYFMLAQSLLAGDGYRTAYRVPAADETRWPPLFPALLVPISSVTLGDITAVAFERRVR